jgi:hypothetical protein
MKYCGDPNSICRKERRSCENFIVTTLADYENAFHLSTRERRRKEAQELGAEETGKNRILS